MYPCFTQAICFSFKLLENIQSSCDRCQGNTKKVSPWTLKMEELRSAVIKHQKNFSELVVTDNAIKDGINCNSKNLEALKNLTLKINDRDKTLEDSLENKQILDKKDIVIVKKDLKTLNYKIDSVEDKLVDLVKGAVENVECKISRSIQDNERDRRNL